MIKVFTIAGLVLGLAGCQSLVDLTPAQQANLQAELALGKMVVQATANIVCVYEPTTTKLIGVFDKSKNTNAMLTQIDQATTLICAQALKTGS